MIGTEPWSSDVVQDGYVMPLWYPDGGILNHQVFHSLAQSLLSTVLIVSY